MTVRDICGADHIGICWSSLAQPPPLAGLAAHERREQLPTHGRLHFLFLEPGAQQEPKVASGWFFSVWFETIYGILD